MMHRCLRSCCLVSTEHPEAKGLPIPNAKPISGPQPQLCASSFVQREDEVPYWTSNLDMAMAPQPHAPAIMRRKSQMPKVVFIPALMATPVVGERPSRSGEVVVPSDRRRACSSSHTRLHD